LWLRIAGVIGDGARLDQVDESGSECSEESSCVGIIIVNLNQDQLCRFNPLFTVASFWQVFFSTEPT